MCCCVSDLWPKSIEKNTNVLAIAECCKAFFHAALGCGTQVGRGHSKGTWAQATKWVSHIIMMLSRVKDEVKKEECGKGTFVVTVFAISSNRNTKKQPCLPGNLPRLPMESGEWTPDFALLALTHLLNCLYLNPWLFSLSPFPFSPSSWREGVSELLCGAWLPHRTNLHYHLRLKLITRQRMVSTCLYHDIIHGGA